VAEPISDEPISDDRTTRRCSYSSCRCGNAHRRAEYRGDAG
jgi:hypothetical protein